MLVVVKYFNISLFVLKKMKYEFVINKTVYNKFNISIYKYYDSPFRKIIKK